jgi:hypothetical protein
MQARLRPKRNCGCSLEEAFFLILLWNVYVRARA